MPDKPNSPLFEVLGYRVYSEKDVDAMKTRVAEAKIRIRIGGEEQLVIAEGDGPVNALDNALRKALVPNFPVLRKVHLSDYWVRILNSERATASSVEVLVFTSDGTAEPLVTRGISTDIIEASLEALIKSFTLTISKST